MTEINKKRRRRSSPGLMMLAGMGALAAVVATGVSVATGIVHRAPAAQSANLAPWVGRVNALLVQRFSWIEVRATDRVAQVLGEAPSDAVKVEALAAARAAIGDDAGSAVAVIVDAISVAGGDGGVGAALAALGDAPDAPACQTAFAETLKGRFVAFESASAAISEESAALLDALTGAAILCKAHGIEVGGHTDSRGAATENLRLSQARAEAVRAYLIERGVPEARLTAMGYGEARPIDPAETQEAFAANRRIEFTVTP